MVLVYPPTRNSPPPFIKIKKKSFALRHRRSKPSQPFSKADRPQNLLQTLSLLQEQGSHQRSGEALGDDGRGTGGDDGGLDGSLGAVAGGTGGARGREDAGAGGLGLPGGGGGRVVVAAAGLAGAAGVVDVGAGLELGDGRGERVGKVLDGVGVVLAALLGELVRDVVHELDHAGACFGGSC